MADKYYFNKELLRYEKKKRSFRSTLVRYALFILLYLVSIIGFILITIYYWNTPRERFLILKQQNLENKYKALQEKVNNVDKSLTIIEKRDNEVYRSIFETNPIPYDQRIKGIAGRGETRMSFEGVSENKLTEIIDIQIEQINNRLETQTQSLKDISRFVRNKKKIIRAIPAIQPISNKQLIRFSSGFGYRTDPIYKVSKMHSGVDFSAPTGTPVYATANGTVTYAKYTSSGYGRHIIINHGYGYQTLYAHLSKIKTRKWAKVKRGEVIGYVGSTGKSTAPHLHYEVIKKKKKVNPIYFFYSDLNENQFEELLKRAQLNNQSFD